MRCGEATKLFSSVYDGEAGSSELRLRGHLSDCAGCSKALDAYTQDLDFLGPAMRRIVAGVTPWPVSQTSQQPQPVPERAWNRFWTLGAAALSAAALTVVVTLPRSGGGPTEVSESGPVGPLPRNLEVLTIADEHEDPRLIADYLGPEFVVDGKAWSATCPTSVGVTHPATRAQLQLVQQAPDPLPNGCDGFSLELAEGQGCLEIGCEGNLSELRWHRGSRWYRLRGKFGAAEAFRMAGDVRQIAAVK